MEHNSLANLCVWPDNTQCYMYELHEMQHMSDDYLVVSHGSLFYPDGITIHEVDYDTVVNARRVMANAIKGEKHRPIY